MIFLDTNAAIAALNDNPRRVADTIAARLKGGNMIAISSIAIFELEFGVGKSTRKLENAQQLQRFLESAIEIVPFDAADACVAGHLRAALEKSGTSIGPYDLLIAGQALRHNATLVTANTREFKRVKGLRLENWTKAP